MESTGVTRNLAIILAAAAIAVAACAIQPTDFSPIKVGAARATVESVLGKPVKTTKTEAGTVDTYRYNRGDPEDLITWQDLEDLGGRSTGLDYALAPYIATVFVMTAPVWGPLGQHSKYERQRGEIDITYGPRDTVVAIFPMPTVANPDSLTVVESGPQTAHYSSQTSVLANDTGPEGNRLTAVLESDVSNGILRLNHDGTFRYAHTAAGTTADSFSYMAYDGTTYSSPAKVSITLKPVPMAEQSYGDAQYLLAYAHLQQGRIAEAFKGMCLAAHEGHANARDRMGDAYRGDPLLSANGPQDVVKAYLWYTLAIANGSPYSEISRQDLANEMTFSQIAEARRLVEEWKPDPKSCEVAGAPISSSG